MRFLKISIYIFILFALIGCNKSSVESKETWVNLTEEVKIRAVSEYVDGGYLQVKLDISEKGKNPVYANGKSFYNNRLTYFNSSIIEDVKIKGEKLISPFDIHTERNFGYKEYLTVLFFFSVDENDLDKIEYIQYIDNCFGVGKVKLEFK